jgi:hypothetical protein
MKTKKKPNQKTIQAMQEGRMLTQLKPIAYTDFIEFYTLEQYAEFDEELRKGLVILYSIDIQENNQEKL